MYNYLSSFSTYQWTPPQRSGGADWIFGGTLLLIDGDSSDEASSSVCFWLIPIHVLLPFNVGLRSYLGQSSSAYIRRISIIEGISLALD